MKSRIENILMKIKVIARMLPGSYAMSGSWGGRGIARMLPGSYAMSGSWGGRGIARMLPGSYAMSGSWGGRGIAVAMLMACAVPGRADRYSDYIERYSEMAIDQQEMYGIPASITLAQGLLESAAGRSTLATEGNNHFGIKCHRDWTGPTMLRDDDAAGECFRVYGDASESYTDHSKFLSRKRYSPLFELDPGDYAGWARTLKACGYATDPNYADRLIAIIERYALYVYDSEAGRTAEETAVFIVESLKRSHAVRKGRGLHYIIATPGDTYGSIAKEFHLDLKRLLSYNDKERDGEVKAWEEVYLQEKRDEGPDGIGKVTIGADETIHSISQRYGMKLESLRRLNPKVKDKPGQKLRLR